ncbi:MAG TPA: zinc ribbon domain-containing protein [Gaiellaceae bacterium]|nr:zinc ribbon domain-containing protein [Gaiellaceae bacterium]
MQACPECGNGVERRFRFCPWCATPLRSKLVEFFMPHPKVPGDSEKVLRVSRYAACDERPAQVRFSIWNVDRAEAVVSLTEEEAARLAAFVASPPAARASLVEQLRESLRL